jgi:carboxymethylenebutenolidase
MDQVETVRAAVAGRPGVELHVQEQAGHAFENHLAPQFHDADAAARSWPLTVDFLKRTLEG